MQQASPTKKPTTPHTAVNACILESLSPLEWEIGILKNIIEPKDRLEVLKARKIPQVVNSLPSQADIEIHVDLIAKAIGISVKAVEDILTNSVDLFSELSTAFGGAEGVKKADPLRLADHIFKWFTNSAKGRFFKTGDSKVWLFYNGQIFEIDNNLLFNTLMYRLTRFAAIEKPGNLVWYYLRTMCSDKGEPIDMVSWIFTDREKDTVYINLNSTHNKIIRIVAGEEITPIDNGTNEYSVLLSASPQIRHFEFQPAQSEADGFTALKFLMMDTLPVERPQRYFHTCWLITVFLIDYQGDRGIQQIIGTSGLGKSKVAERDSYLVYGENYVGRGTGAGDVRIATHNPLNFIDNLENRDLNQARLDFLLLLANSSTKPKAKAGSDTEVVYQRLKSMGEVTSIEPFPGKYPELINRTFPLVLDKRYRIHGYMHDEVVREIQKNRNLILSAIFKMIGRVVLSRLHERIDWSKFIHTKYPGHNKERMNEHLCMMMLVLEGLLEFIPYHKDNGVPIKKQAEEILECWIREIEEQAHQTAITSNTILTQLDGLVHEVRVKARGRNTADLRYEDVPNHFKEPVRIFSDPEYLHNFYFMTPVIETSQDEDELEDTIERVVFIVTAAELYTVLNRFGKNQNMKNSFENPTALSARISNDKDILEKGGWEIIYPYKKVMGSRLWRFEKKIKLNQ